MMKHRQKAAALIFPLLLTTCMTARAADQPQWGEKYSRNMISQETGLPDSFDPATGENIRWSVPLGTSYATPVVSTGRVLIGCNNGEPRDERHRGDRGILLCLDERDGSVQWQLVVPKIGGDVYLDWPQAGMCSPATVEGDRVYVVTNRAEVVCLDLHGQANGNDGPYRDEGAHMTPAGDDPMQVTPLDADILWLFDMVAEAGVYPHDSAHSSILIDGDYLYLNTGNGVDNTHKRIRAPEAPSLIVLDKKTGRLVAQDGERIGPRIFHCTWSSPALGRVNASPRIFFGGGDGVCYGFQTVVPSAGADNTSIDNVSILDRVWRFDCDPTGPKEEVSRYLRNRKESPSNIKSMPVFHNNRLYVTVGGDIWWGKEQAWLKCIDATGSGDVTDSGQIWSYTLNKHCCSTPSIHNGLVYVVDCGKILHCVDAETGKACWTHELDGEAWGSTLVADGKVYVGMRRGDFWIFAADRKKRLIASIDLDDPISATPVAANGVLYIATQAQLHAVATAPRHE